MPGPCGELLISAESAIRHTHVQDPARRRVIDLVRLCEPGSSRLLRYNFRFDAVPVMRRRNAFDPEYRKPPARPEIEHEEFSAWTERTKASTIHHVRVGEFTPSIAQNGRHCHRLSRLGTQSAADRNHE